MTLSEYDGVAVVDLCPGSVGPTALICGALFASDDRRATEASVSKLFVAISSAQHGSSLCHVEVDENRFCYRAPVGDTLRFSVIDECGQRLYSSQQVALDEHVDLGDLSVAPREEFTSTVRFETAAEQGQRLLLEVQLPQATDYRWRERPKVIALANVRGGGSHTVSFSTCRDSLVRCRLVDPEAGTIGEWVTRPLSDTIELGTLRYDEVAPPTFAYTQWGGAVRHLFIGESAAFALDTAKNALNLTATFIGVAEVFDLALNYSARAPHEYRLDGVSYGYLPVPVSKQSVLRCVSADSRVAAGPFANAILQVREYREMSLGPGEITSVAFSGVVGPVRVVVDDEVKLIEVIFRQRKRA